MNYEPHDDLDRLLFALPLEEPPKDLRASILASTIYRPSFPFKVWETWALGIVMAVGVWLCVMIAQGGGQAFIATVGLFGEFFARFFVSSGTGLWLAVGGGIAFLLLILNPGPMLGVVPGRYSRR
ncbi:MAG: hypothetical protein GIW97_04910 [Candidatus Eremiobacteraeota bacterium]|nr:hypothetical protein [Candidatus Eremiobacteraeota bacterium]